MLKWGIVVIIAVCIITSSTALAKSGDLDTSFNGPTGYVFYEPGISGTAVAIQPDRKIVVVGTTFNGMNQDVLVLRYDSNGMLDVSFGENGIVTYDGGYIDRGSAVAVQPDGKIVVAGSSHNGPNSFNVRVLRYDSKGTLDTGFGTNGSVTYNGTLSDASDYGDAVAVQSDGKIVVAGSTTDSTGTHLLVLRYNSNGAPDGTFGTGGVVSYNYKTTAESNDYGRAVAIQPDGKIVVAGYTQNGSDPEDALIIRLNDNGTLDTNFSGGDGAVVFDNSGGHETGNAVAIQEDGRIVVVGITDDAVLTLRYNGNGTLDETFGEKGMVAYRGQNPAAGQYYNFGSAVAIQADGKIAVGGSSTTGAYQHLLILRYESDGTSDQSFGSSGEVIFESAPNYSDEAASMAFQPDGKIVIAGTRQSDTEGNADILVVRIMGQEFMSPPASQQFFSYPPTVLPALDMSPPRARPIGVGPVALTGGDALTLSVGLPPLAEPVDLYVGILAPLIDPINLYILRSDYSLQPALLGLVPWKNLVGPLEENLFGEIPVAGLPQGTYYLYLVATPAGGVTHYYIWETWFVIE